MQQDDEPSRRFNSTLAQIPASPENNFTNRFYETENETSKNTQSLESFLSKLQVRPACLERVHAVLHAAEGQIKLSGFTRHTGTHWVLWFRYQEMRIKHMTSFHPDAEILMC